VALCANTLPKEIAVIAIIKHNFFIAVILIWFLRIYKK